MINNTHRITPETGAEEFSAVQSRLLRVGQAFNNTHAAAIYYGFYNPAAAEQLPTASAEVERVAPPAAVSETVKVVKLMGEHEQAEHAAMQQNITDARFAVDNAREYPGAKA